MKTHDNGLLRVFFSVYTLIQFSEQLYRQLCCEVQPLVYPSHIDLTQIRFLSGLVAQSTRNSIRDLSSFDSLVKGHSMFGRKFKLSWCVSLHLQFFSLNTTQSQVSHHCRKTVKKFRKRISISRAVGSQRRGKGDSCPSWTC